VPLLVVISRYPECAHTHGDHDSATGKNWCDD